MELEGLLAGKCAFITGASSGIGAAAARVFCREGAAVMLVARREERLAALVGELRGEGFEADYVVADVVRGGEVAGAVERTVSRFGRLDVAFNNAGVGARQVALHEMGVRTRAGHLCICVGRLCTRFGWSRTCAG